MRRKGLYSSNSVMGLGRAPPSQMQWVESKISYMCCTILTTRKSVAARVKVLASICVPSFECSMLSVVCKVACSAWPARVNVGGAAADTRICGCATDAIILVTGLCGSALGARCCVLEKFTFSVSPVRAALKVWTIASQVWRMVASRQGVWLLAASHPSPPSRK